MKEHGCLFITGASRGIGRGLALRFAKKGYKVGAFARSSEDLESLKAEISACGGTLVAVVGSVSDRVAVLDAIRLVEASIGPIDILIGNAGISQPNKARSFSGSAVADIFSTNVMGLAYCLEGVLPGMMARGRGHIVGISSLASLTPMIGHGAYAASKSAVNYLLSALRQELKNKPATSKLTITTICPGFIKTDMTAKNAFKMPFLMELDQALDLIERSIERRDHFYCFPWPLALLLKTLGLMPHGLREFMLMKFAR